MSDKSTLELPGIGVTIKADTLNEYLAKQILESKLGKCVEDSINRVISELDRSYNNPLDAYIKEFVRNVILDQLRDPESSDSNKIKQVINAAVTRHLSTEVLDKIVSNLFNNL